MLNKLKLASSQPGHPSSPLEYTHLHLVDTFYTTEGGKVRVTRDEKTGEVVACMQKVRIASMDILSPNRFADWRISVNAEIPGMSTCACCVYEILSLCIVQMPIGTANMSRRKDRVSYTHEEFIIDLTQVTSSSSPNMKVRIAIGYFNCLSAIFPFSRKSSMNSKLSLQGQITYSQRRIREGIPTSQRLSVAPSTNSSEPSSTTPEYWSAMRPQMDGCDRRAACPPPPEYRLRGCACTR